MKRLYVLSLIALVCIQGCVKKELRKPLPLAKRTDNRHLNPVLEN